MPNLKNIKFTQMIVGKTYIYKTGSEETTLKLHKKRENQRMAFDVIKSNYRDPRKCETSGLSSWWDDGNFFINEVKNRFEITAKNGKAITCSIKKI